MPINKIQTILRPSYEYLHWWNYIFKLNEGAASLSAETENGINKK